MARSPVGLALLASDYQTSLEAILRRLLDLSDERMVAVFFRWKLKPAQKWKRIGRKDQPSLFGDDPEEEAKALMKLRVENALMNETYGLHILPNESIESAGVIFEASASNSCLDVGEDLDLGPCRGRVRIAAVPLYADDRTTGPKGETAVVTLLRPLAARGETKQMLPPLTMDGLPSSQ